MFVGLNWFVLIASTAVIFNKSCVNSTVIASRNPSGKQYFSILLLLIEDDEHLLPLRKIYETGRNFFNFCILEKINVHVETLSHSLVLLLLNNNKSNKCNGTIKC